MAAEKQSEESRLKDEEEQRKADEIAKEERLKNEAAEAARLKAEQDALKNKELSDKERAEAEEKQAREREELLRLEKEAADQAEAKRIAQQEERAKDEAERLAAKEAAQAIANGPRESDELANLINEEAVKQETRPVTTNSPQIGTPSGGSKVAQATMDSDERPMRPVRGGAVAISDNRVGEKALSTSSANMSEDDIYDGVMKTIEAEQSQMQVEAEQRALIEKYPARKTTETEKAGNSVITYVYINRGEFVNVYKKVEHSWGGVFFFIDERATNQRFWEHETL